MIPIYKKNSYCLKIKNQEFHTRIRILHFQIQTNIFNNDEKVSTYLLLVSSL